jgi:hypothetical protein
VNATIGWGLAAAAVVAGWFAWGWQGVVLALTVVVFWLLLQFSRTMRVLRGAAARPLGHVDSAVMLHAKLREGARLVEILALTRSLGRRLGESENPERFAWRDAGGDEVEVELVAGRCTRWTLRRAEDSAAPPAL